jgi:hypothetical protein
VAECHYAIGDLDWTIDVHIGLLDGIVLAEVELEHPSERSRASRVTASENAHAAA